MERDLATGEFVRGGCERFSHNERDTSFSDFTRSFDRDMFADRSAMSKAAGAGLKETW